MQFTQVHSHDNQLHNNMVITCNFNFNCNFKCSYCINKNQHDKYKTPLSETALNNLMYYLPELKKDKYSFYIAGGEPALYPHWDKFFAVINEKFTAETECTIGTNGYFINRFEPFIKMADNYSLSLLVSMHTEQLPIEEYIQRLKNFPYPLNCKIKFMLDPGKLDTALATISALKTFGYQKFIIQSIVINQKPHPDYSEEELNFFKTNPYQDDFAIDYEWIENNQKVQKTLKRDDFILDSRLIDFSGMYCMAGANAIRVLADGTVTLCYAHRGDPNFNLNEKTILDYIYIYKAVTCPSKRCACPPYTELPKWNPEFATPPAYFNGELE